MSEGIVLFTAFATIARQNRRRIYRIAGEKIKGVVLYNDMSKN